MLYCIFVVTHIHMVNNLTYVKYVIEEFLSYFIQCQNCQVKHHLTCIDIKKDEIISNMWYCPACVRGIFAYNHFDDDEDFDCAILEGGI